MILSLDVGVTTGACVLHYDYTLKWVEDLDEQELNNVFREHLVPEIVVELPLIQGLGELAHALQTVRNTVLGNAPPTTYYVQPSQWKQTPLAGVKVPRGLSQHQRDAIRIAVWYNNYVLKGGKVPSMIEYR